MTAQKFLKDRYQAGTLLAQRLSAYSRHPDAIVLGLPRGGVPVAYAVAKALDLPLDVFLVRKLGVPGNEEYAMGAIASGGLRVISKSVCDMLAIPISVVEQSAQRALQEIERRENLYHGDHPALPLQDRIVIVVDDGLATGSTMLAAVKALRQADPARIIVAVPVAASDSCRHLRPEVDELICLATPEPFYAVGLWYEDFTQTSDAEVQALLEKARLERQAGTLRPLGQSQDNARNGNAPGMNPSR